VGLEEEKCSYFSKKSAKNNLRKIFMHQIKNKRILLVDNNEHYIRFLKRRLLARNFEIVGEARNSKQAIELFKSEKPDLTLLEFEMPSINGSMILEEILTINPDALVIMLTGRGDIAAMQLCIDKGAFHYIGKDYPFETIFSVIDESIEKFAEIES